MRTAPDDAAKQKATNFAEKIGQQLRRGQRARMNGAMGVRDEPWKDAGRVTLWTAHTKVPFVVPFGLYGAWELRLRWRWMPNRSAGCRLLDASISLNVELPTLREGMADPLSGAGLPRGTTFCLIRYDYEDHGDRPGRHLNVWQGQPLEDKAHWRLPSPDTLTTTPWSAQHVVDYLISAELEADLRKGAWPST